MDENALRVVVIGSVSILRHMQARAQEIIATAPTETSARCVLCGHEPLWFDYDSGTCQKLVIPPKCAGLGMAFCCCKCIFPESTGRAREVFDAGFTIPASTEVAGEQK